MSIHEPAHTKECRYRIEKAYGAACICGADERAQRDDEAWMHAACLSIAEGVRDWQKPLEHDSLAMRTVRGLRLRYEEAKHAAEQLALENKRLMEEHRHIIGQLDQLHEKRAMDMKATARAVEAHASELAKAASDRDEYFARIEAEWNEHMGRR